MGRSPALSPAGVGAVRAAGVLPGVSKPRSSRTPCPIPATGQSPRTPARLPRSHQCSQPRDSPKERGKLT